MILASGLGLGGLVAGLLGRKNRCGKQAPGRNPVRNKERYDLYTSLPQRHSCAALILRVPKVAGQGLCMESPVELDVGVGKRNPNGVNRRSTALAGELNKALSPTEKGSAIPIITPCVNAGPATNRRRILVNLRTGPSRLPERPRTWKLNAIDSIRKWEPSARGLRRLN